MSKTTPSMMLLDHESRTVLVINDTGTIILSMAEAVAMAPAIEQACATYECARHQDARRAN